LLAKRTQESEWCPPWNVHTACGKSDLVYDGQEIAAAAVRIRSATVFGCDT
jgi:hypothetical protein